MQRIVSHKYQEGEFTFYELPKVVAIGEDATRLISRVEYDNETNRLVGFVLSCDERGLPLNDTFIEVSFEAIEQAFEVVDVAKYAFVYMAPPFKEGVPSFVWYGHDQQVYFQGGIEAMETPYSKS